MLVDGVMAPVAAFRLKPEAALNAPPVVPATTGLCAVETDVQNGPGYETLAVGGAVMVTFAVVLTAAQPFADGTV